MSQNGTSTGISGANLASAAEAARFDLSARLVKLMLDEPFHAAVLRGVNFIKTDAIPTAGVLAKDSDITMWWNPQFVAGLEPQKVIGLLKHESFHLALEHTTTRRMTPHIIHNYATDLAINSDIDEDELPEGGLVPGKPFAVLTEEQKMTMDPEAVERYVRVSAKIASLPPGEASEWYFARLMEDPQVREDIEGGQGHGGKSISDALADGDLKVDKDGNLVDKDGNPVAVMPGGFDDHDGWDELSDEERELVKGKIKQAVTDAVKECDSTGRWGSVGAATRSTLRQLISTEVDWRSVLKRFCGASQRSSRQTSWSRLNRKYAGKVPGTKRSYTSKIAVYIDQSGSVDDGALSLAFGELRTLVKRAEFVTFHFDTTVDKDSETAWRRGKAPETHRTRFGGTDFQCVTDHANANKHRFDGYLIITDGEAAKPKPSRLKRGWMIVPGRKLLFSADKSDFVLRMKPSKKAA